MRNFKLNTETRRCKMVMLSDDAIKLWSSNEAWRAAAKVKFQARANESGDALQIVGYCFEPLAFISPEAS